LGLTANDRLDVNYVGNHGTHLITSSLNRNQPTYLAMGQATLNSLNTNHFYGHIAAGTSSCGLDQPTVVQSRLLTPYPQYCGVGENDATVGFSNYNALQVSYNHRFSQGLTAPYDSGITGDEFVKNPDGSVYVGDVWPGKSVFPDFTRQQRAPGLARCTAISTGKVFPAFGMT
jgi:hypothetical protein